MTEKRKDLKTLRAEMIDLVREIGVENTADHYGINMWHVHMMVNDKDFVLSPLMRKRMGIVKDARPRRIAIHTTDMDSASRSIITNIAPELVEKLIDNLIIDSRYPSE